MFNEAPRASPWYPVKRSILMACPGSGIPLQKIHSSSGKPVVFWGVDKILFVFAVFASIFLFSGLANAQLPNVIYGYVKNGDGTPIADAEIWTCASKVPETFPECNAFSLGKSAGDGRWFAWNFEKAYYRIWATYPNSYSQTVTFHYEGGEKYWGTLVLANNPPPSQPAVRIISPNGGQNFSAGDILNIRWEAYNMSSNARTNITLFRSSKNPVKEQLCDTVGSGGCTESTYNFVANAAFKTANDGIEAWVVPQGLVRASDYFLRITCYDNVLNRSCGSDDSDNPFSMGVVMAPASLPPPSPPAKQAPPSLAPTPAPSSAKLLVPTYPKIQKQKPAPPPTITPKEKNIPSTTPENIPEKPVQPQPQGFFARLRTAFSRFFETLFGN